MKVLYGVNPGYLLPSLVSIHSLWTHATRAVDVTIYQQGFGVAERELVCRFEDAWERPVKIRDFDAEGLEGFGKANRSGLPPVSLFPLFLPDLEEGRCLYMDADTLFRGDAHQLWSHDLGGLPIGACNDIGMLQPGRLAGLGVGDVLLPSYARTQRRRRINDLLEQSSRVGVVPKNYFNSGVVLMDCDMIRRTGCKDELADMDRLKWHASEGCFPDQDRMNEVFAGRWFRLPLKCNTVPHIRRLASRIQSWADDDDVLAQVSDAMEGPLIWHYYGTRKPWGKVPWIKRIKERQAFVEYRAATSDFTNRTKISFCWQTAR